MPGLQGEERGDVVSDVRMVRLRNDDAIAGAVSSKWAKGTGGPAGDECYNLVAAEIAPTQSGHVPTIAYGIRNDAARSGEAKTPSMDGNGITRLRNAGLNISEELAPTVDTGSGHSVAMAFKPSHYTRGKDGAPDDVVPPLGAEPDKGDQDPILFEGVGTAVRRLTPRECERLQAFEDDYTLIHYRGAPAADGPRYKALGNAMNVNEIRWVLQRIELFEGRKK